MRPSSLTLTVAGDSVTLTPQPTVVWNYATGANQWHYQYTGVPKYVKGSTTPISYTVTETPAGGYLSSTATVSGTVNADTRNVTEADFTNTLITVNLTGSKRWEDNSNYYAMRPATITVNISENGTLLSPQPVLTWSTTGNNWSYSCTGLPKYRKGGAALATYSATETAVAGYTTTPSATIAGVADGSGNFTVAEFVNTLRTVSLSGSKTWSDQNNLYGRRPADITLTLMAGAVAMTPLSGITWNKTGEPWTYSITGLPRYKKGTSTAIVYSVIETAITDYTTTPSLTAIGSVNGTTGYITNANFTNTLATVSVSGKKTWQDQANYYGMRPDELQLTLLADGVALYPQPTPSWNKLSSTTEWTYTYAQVPKYREDHVTAIVYTVQETPTAGYATVGDTTVSGTKDANGTVTDANFTNDLITVDIAGGKTWVDDSNRYGMRPTGITLTVLADGVAIAPQPSVTWVKPDGSSVWTYRFADLPRYQKGTTTQIVYTVKETPVSDYALTSASPATGTVDPTTGDVTEANFTNTLATVSLTGEKSWSDISNRYATRPETLTLTVLADSVAMVPQPVVAWSLDENTWSYSTSGLPRWTTTRQP